MDKHINILMQLYKYHWTKDQEKHDLLKPFDEITLEYRQFLYKYRIFDLLKDG